MYGDVVSDTSSSLSPGLPTHGADCRPISADSSPSSRRRSEPAVSHMTPPVRCGLYVHHCRPPGHISEADGDWGGGLVSVPSPHRGDSGPQTAATNTVTPGDIPLNCGMSNPQPFPGSHCHGELAPALFVG